MNDHLTISAFDFARLFPDETAARVYMESKLWPEGPVCPVCGGLDNITPRTRRGYYRCNPCKGIYVYNSPRKGASMSERFTITHTEHDYNRNTYIGTCADDVTKEELGKALIDYPQLSGGKVNIWTDEWGKRRFSVVSYGCD